MIKKFFRIIKLGFVICFVALVGAFIFAVLPILGVGIEPDVDKNVLINIRKKDDVSQSLYLAHFGEIGQAVRVYKIDGGRKIDLPIGEYGEYELNSVVRLLEIDKKDESYILATFSRILGFAINDLLNISIAENTDNQADYANEFSNKIFWQQGLADLKSLKIISARTNLQLYFKFKEIEMLSEEKFMAKKDNYQVISINDSSFCNLAVINASNKNGLASEFADYLEKSGATVVKIDNTSEKFDKTTFYFDQAESSNACFEIMNKISGIFVDTKNQKPISELRDQSQYRAKMVIFLTE